MSKDKQNFIECDTCRAKPGSPPLCGGCVNNRAVINYLRYEIEIGKDIDVATKKKCEWDGKFYKIDGFTGAFKRCKNCEVMWKASELPPICILFPQESIGQRITKNCIGGQCTCSKCNPPKQGNDRFRLKIFTTHTRSIIPDLKSIELDFNVWSVENAGKFEVDRTYYAVNKRLDKTMPSPWYEELAFFVFYKIKE